ncbi:MAG: hypothetical protein FWF72_07115 [Paludibacter sp.]|nr:hypothetical protein [Paludibacter sp.]
MKKSILMVFSGLVMFAMVGCGVSATKYNDNVVDIHTKASNYLTKVSDKLDYNALSAAEKQSIADSLKIKIDAWTKQIKDLKYPASAEEYQGSMVKYFEFLQSDVVPVMQNLFLSANKDEFNSHVDAFNTVLQTGMKLEDEIEAKQVEFARKNNMQLR